MAKIYETTADVEKDQIKEQASGLRTQAAIEGGSGALLIGGALVNELIRRNRTEPAGWTKWLSLGLVAVGGLAGLKSVFTASSASNLEAESEKVSDNVTILPPENPTKSYSEGLSPKSPIDHADKDCSCGLSKS